MLYAPNIYTIHRGQKAGEGFNPAVWHDILGRMLAPDGGGGGRYRNIEPAILGFLPTVTTTAYNDMLGGYVGVLADIGASITPSPTLANTSVIATGATSNNEVYIQSDFNKGAAVKVGEGDIAFEARLNPSKVASDSIFAGLAAPGLVANAISDAQALSDINAIGFHFRSTDNGNVQFVYRKAGSAAVYIDLGIPLAAAAWVNLGFTIEQEAPQVAKKVRIFVDNEEKASISRADFDGSAFPNTAPLSPSLGLKTSAASNSALSMQFAAAVQAPRNYG